MRAKGRFQGQFVALSGLRKVVGPPGGRYAVIIVDSAGLPLFHVCEWYRRRKEMDPGRTTDTYLDMLLPLVGFELRHGYAWNDAPDRVHTHLVTFFRDDLKCQVRPAQEQAGYLVETTGQTPLSKSSVGVLLAAVTSFYDVMIDAGYYRYLNPMRSEKLLALKRSHLREVKNAGAPDHAGIRSESSQESRRHPTGYFRQFKGKVWEPELVLEPDDVQQRMRQAVDFMIQHAQSQRDRVVLMLLRSTGARLHEIVGLTAAGYRQAQHACRALVVNKGSHGREEKVIYFTPTIERALLRYIRTERAQHDPQGWQRLSDLDDHAPIFLTHAGTPYNRAAFYYQWYQLFARAHRRFQVAFSPHDLRHLYVTENLMKIRAKANGDAIVERELRDGFRQLMGWRSHETMDVYTHLFNKRRALLEIVLAEDHQEPIQPSSQTSHLPLPVRQPQPMPNNSPPQMESAGDEDVRWYEEEG